MWILKLSVVTHLAAAYQVAQHLFQDDAEKLGLLLAFVGSAVVSYCWPRRFRCLASQCGPVKVAQGLGASTASGVRRVVAS